MKMRSTLHVLHNKVGGAVVNKAFERLLVGELQVGQHVADALLAVRLVGHMAVLLDDVESFHEMPLAEIFDHVSLELAELATGYVDHILVVVREAWALARAAAWDICRRAGLLIVPIFIISLRQRLLGEC